MSALIHVQVQVVGAPEAREAYRLKVAELLADEGYLEFQTLQGEDRLVYDLKVAGGIPFPPFVIASQECRGVTVEVDWVNVHADEHGTATIIEGRLQSTAVSCVDDDAGQRTFASVDLDEGLRLAFVCVRLAPEVFRGYAISGDRDMVFHLSRDTVSGRCELLTSASTPDWSDRWVLDPNTGTCDHASIDPPPPIEDAEYSALAELAEAFAEVWIWFDDAPEEEVAIERERMSHLGIPERKANVKSARLRQMAEIREGSRRLLQSSSLDAGSEWVREALERSWVVA